MKSIGLSITTLLLLLILVSCNQQADQSISYATNTLGVNITPSSSVPPFPSETSTWGAQTAFEKFRATKTARAKLTPSTSTPTPTFTSTSTNTFTPTFTPTPYPDLSQSGPYLVYLVALPDGQKAVRLLDADGTGRKTLPLPDGSYIEDVQAATSFTDGWIAFHTGSLQKEPYDLALNIMHLPDGKISKIINLLSSEYPTNFDEIASNLLQNPNSYLSWSYDAPALSREIKGLFRSGIYTLEWSPKGRYLAFSGQMDGLSSDIYRYDSQTGSIIRLTDGPEQICEIHWSPDWKWILHEASNDPLGEGWTPDIFAVTFDGSKTKMLSSHMYFGGWVAPTTYAIYHAANGPGSYGLQLVDIESVRTVFSWPDSFQDFAFDTQSNIIAISNEPIKNREMKEGVYLVYPDGNSKFIAGGYWGLLYWGGQADRFIGVNIGDNTYSITKDGEITKISSKTGWISISPDSQWMLIYRNDRQGIDLYSEKDGFVRHIADFGPEDIIWRPDSSAVFYRLKTDLYSISLPEGKPVVVDRNLVVMGWENNDDYGFAWIK